MLCYKSDTEAGLVDLWWTHGVREGWIIEHRTLVFRGPSPLLRESRSHPRGKSSGQSGRNDGLEGWGGEQQGRRPWGRAVDLATTA